MTTPIPSLRERELQTRREAILDAAYGLLIEGGYSGLNMDELASRLEVAKTTLYQQYASKDELVIQVLLRRMLRTAEALAPGRQDESAITRLERATIGVIEGRRLLSPRHVEVPPRLLADPRCQKQERDIDDLLAALIDQARDDGDLTSELPTPAVVRLLVAVSLGNYDDLFDQDICTPAELGRALRKMLRISGSSAPDGGSASG